jgi:hypothetical protein
MPPVWAKVAVVAAACPTGVNAYVVAARFRTGEALASNVITISTGLAVVSMTLWLTVIELIEEGGSRVRVGGQGHALAGPDV